ncbi:hypothetical protein MP638_004598 [Amoeboaphelidium occidentale]|nr:hypothetical protein MP638_004598 [Amoeboaphelidium occidentale]
MNDDIVNLCIQKFIDAPKSCKPDPIQAYIISGIVEENTITKELELICLCSGVKCLPNTKISQHGDLLHDMHAEVLARRSFLRYLCSNFKDYREGSDSIFFKDSNGLLSVNDHLKYHMYISQAPCGDASIVQLSRKNEGKTPYTDVPVNHVVIQGNLHYDALGRLRLKPGRIDSIPTRSMSCSDKICRWNALGIQGGLLSTFLNPVYLETLIIDELFDYKELKRSLNQRYPEGKKLHFAKASVPFLYGKTNDNEYCNISFNWIVCDKTFEVCVDGRKFGTGKGSTNLPIPVKSRSRLCKQNMFQLLSELQNMKDQTFSLKLYQQMKLQNLHYSIARGKFMEHSNFRNWVFTHTQYNEKEASGIYEDATRDGLQ